MELLGRGVPGYKTGRDKMEEVVRSLQGQQWRSQTTLRCNGDTSTTPTVCGLC